MSKQIISYKILSDINDIAEGKTITVNEITSLCWHSSACNFRLRSSKSNSSFGRFSIISAL